MGKINVLDKHIAELIAAGEVVERPSSAIKELVENSIDAGATAITVEIKNGGVSYMRITDNGCGIEKDDIKNAFLRNATSKIKFEDDLNGISTLGFRGEALFSICAVSKVELLTRTENQVTGIHYKIEGGEEVLFEECGCSEGTTIVVRDLFYNTPARMKFLKKDSSEGSSIAKVLDRMVLSHPEIAFKFVRENKLELNTPGNGKIGSAIYAVYGKEFFSTLMELKYKLNGISVRGFVSKPTSPRASRGMQHFFINGRYVKSRTAMVALEEAFKGSIMVQKFPACVMYIDLPPDVIDVNVHPSKVEVRFVDERPIFDAIYHGVKTALLKGANPVLGDEKQDFVAEKTLDFVDNKILKNIESANSKVESLKDKVSLFGMNNSFSVSRENKKTSVESLKDFDAPEVFIPKKTENAYTEKTISINKTIRNDEKFFNLAKSDGMPKKTLNVDEVLPNRTTIFSQNNERQDEFRNDIVPKKVLRDDEELLNKPVEFSPVNMKQNEQLNLISDEIEIKIKGEIFNTYIIVEKNKDEIVFIDKHAAHERMIYEELKSSQMAPLPQIFLEPVVISLSKEEYVAILENMKLFVKAGFEMDDFGNNTVVVRAAPSYLENVYVSDIVVQMANYILENKKNINSDYVEWLYENIACRAAIKAGKEAKFEEMQALVKRIIKEDPRFCPHGRPVAITVKKRDIEKRFGRM